MNKTHKIKVFVAISSKEEGSNIYMPGGGFDIWESKENARKFGWKDKDIVEAYLTYKTH